MRSILIANRGEIAARIARTSHALGYDTVAVTTQADRDAPFLRQADRVVAVDSYLSVESILGAARSAGADAVHPGYGFLSENAGFAQAVVDAGLVFIGPPSESIALMADKGEARERMTAAGVACIPGSSATTEAARLHEEAAAVGFPLLVKATAGGGGRGMRRVERAEDLEQAAEEALREVATAFGGSSVFLERLLVGARHVEVQVLADRHGNVAALGERDCSVQRRHQKVIEEAPSPAVDAGLRRRLCELAVQVARAAGYSGAGTVELLLTPTGEAFFLEMNTRLQVEHPVTECTTGLDLVEWQLRIAEGEALGDAVTGATLRGHAIEARLYAEDPLHDYRPQTGRVLDWRPQAGAGVRVDHALEAGMRIGPHYDPLLAKVIAWGEDRPTALRRLSRALTSTVLFGLGTNRHLLRKILESDAFTGGSATTDWLETQDLAALTAAADASALRRQAIALAVHLWTEHARGGRPHADALSPPWLGTLESMCNELGAERQRSAVGVRWLDADRRETRVDGISVQTRSIDVDPLAAAAGDATVAIDGVGKRLAYRFSNTRKEAALGSLPAVHLLIEGLTWQIALASALENSTGEDESGDLVRAPMAAQVLRIAASVGDRVERGAELVVLEAMKLQSRLLAERDGTVAAIAVAEGDQVEYGQVLVTLE